MCEDRASFLSPVPFSKAVPQTTQMWSESSTMHAGTEMNQQLISITQDTEKGPDPTFVLCNMCKGPKEHNCPDLYRAAILTVTYKQSCVLLLSNHQWIGNDATSQQALEGITE